MPQLGHLLVRPGVLNISSILNYFDIISYISYIVPTAPILQIQVFFKGVVVCHEVTRIVARSAILELAMAATAVPAAMEMESKSAAQSLRSHAPGARTAVVTVYKLPQINV